MTNINRQFVIAARPVGLVKTSDLSYQETPIPQPGDGEALVQSAYISLDPAMRGQMENRADYAAPLEIGDVMRAGGVGHVIRSNNDAYPQGALVGGTFGMQDFAIASAATPFQVFPEGTDPTAALGILGGTGMTAYFGLLRLGEPKNGDVVVVSGAAGATGSVAGQIAKLKGCTVFGIAGSDEKCAWLTETLGFDGAINYKTEDVGSRLDQLCPNGINIYFDNVGGDILDACLARIAMNARVVICGGISRYNKTGPIPGPVNYFNLVYRRARMEGFIVIDYVKEFPAATAEMKDWLDAGLLQQEATVIEGFNKLPEALVRLFRGDNTGKMMVRTT